MAQNEIILDSRWLLFLHFMYFNVFSSFWLTPWVEMITNYINIFYCTFFLNRFTHTHKFIQSQLKSQLTTWLTTILTMMMSSTQLKMILTWWHDGMKTRIMMMRDEKDDDYDEKMIRVWYTCWMSNFISQHDISLLN